MLDGLPSGAWLLRIVLLGLVALGLVLAGVVALAASFPWLPLPFLGPAVYWIDPIWWVIVALTILAVAAGSLLVLFYALWRYQPAVIGAQRETGRREAEPHQREEPEDRG